MKLRYPPVKGNDQGLELDEEGGVLSVGLIIPDGSIRGAWRVEPDYFWNPCQTLLKLIETQAVLHNAILNF